MFNSSLVFPSSNKILFTSLLGLCFVFFARVAVVAVGVYVVVCVCSPNCVVSIIMQRRRKGLLDSLAKSSSYHLLSRDTIVKVNLTYNNPTKR